MITDKEVRGNILIYCFFQIANIALAVLGFFTFSISIYLIGFTKTLDTFNILFFVFGVVLIILSYYGCKLRNSPFGNFVYSIVLSVIFVFDLILTTALFVDRDKIVDWVMENYTEDKDSTEHLKKNLARNLEIVNNLLLIILLIFVSYF
jgi:hypothetical protein